MWVGRHVGRDPCQVTTETGARPPRPPDTPNTITKYNPPPLPLRETKPTDPMGRGAKRRRGMIRGG